MTIVNDDSRVVNKLEASLTDGARVINYDHHMFLPILDYSQNKSKNISETRATIWWQKLVADPS